MRSDMTLILVWEETGDTGEMSGSTLIAGVAFCEIGTGGICWI
jgi:hypothetical protein